MKYRVLPAAQADLQYIDGWVFSNFGEAAANKAADELYATFELLAEFPEMGLRRPEIADSTKRFFFSSHNWIIYTPGAPLLIHRIFPARTDIRDLSL